MLIFGSFLFYRDCSSSFQAGISTSVFLPFFLLFYSKQMGKQVGGGEGLFCPFLKIRKKCSDLGKNAMTVRIYQVRNQRRGRGGLFICSFSKIGKKYPNLEKKKCPDCGHLQVTFLIYDEVFKSFQAKKPEIFSLRDLSFSCCL